MADTEDTLDLSFNNPSLNAPEENTLLGQLITNKKINSISIISVIQSTWNLDQNVQLRLLDKNMVVCTFKRKSGMLRIEENGPCTIKGAILDVKKWNTNLTLEDVNFSACKF